MSNTINDVVNKTDRVLNYNKQSVPKTNFFAVRSSGPALGKIMADFFEKKEGEAYGWENQSCKPHNTMR